MSTLPFINWRLPKYVDKEDSEGKTSNENCQNIEKLPMKRKNADTVFGNADDHKIGRFETCGNMHNNLQNKRNTSENRFFKSNVVRGTSGHTIDMTHSNQQEYFSNNKSPKKFYFAKEKSKQIDPVIKTKHSIKQSKLNQPEKPWALIQPKLANIRKTYTGLKEKKCTTKKSNCKSNTNSKQQKHLMIDLTDEKASEGQVLGKHFSKKPNVKPNCNSKKGTSAYSFSWLESSMDNYDGCTEDPTALEESFNYPLPLKYSTKATANKCKPSRNIPYCNNQHSNQNCLIKGLQFKGNAISENVDEHNIHTDLNKNNNYSIKQNSNPNSYQVQSQKGESSQINLFANVENDYPEELNKHNSKKILKDSRKIISDCEFLIDPNINSEPENSNQSRKGDCTIIDKLLGINSKVESSRAIIGHKGKINKKTQPLNSQIVDRILNINSLQIKSDDDFVPDSENAGFTLQDFMW